MARKINIDLSKTKGNFDRFFNKCVSTGRAYTILRSDHQRDLEIAAKECGFKYLRFHGLFQDDLGVYREDANGNPIYSWQYADAVYDYILSIGMRPFLVFDFMPEALASGDKTIYWEKANITPPNDYNKWSMLVRETVLHFTNRYGYDEVKNWFFEVWNEPDGYFFTGDLDEYLKLYDSTALAVKSVFEDYRVGGPAVAGNENWISRLINHCFNDNIPLDFVSCHTYSISVYDNGENREKSPSFFKKPMWKPGVPWELGNVCYDPVLPLENVEKAYNAVKESEIPKLDLYFTEWGITYDYWDPLRDSYQAASYMLSQLKKVSGYVKCMSFCEVSDVFEEDGPPTDNFHGGFGLVNLQGIRKPSFFAYKFLNQLGNIELVCDDTESFACTDENGGLQVLLWDASALQNAENKEYFNHDIQPVHEDDMKLTISGLKDGEHTLKIYCVGYRQNDPYTVYLNMDKPNGSLSKEQVEKLKKESSGEPIKTDKIIVKEGTFEYTIKLRDNDVYFITMEHKGVV